VAEDGFTGYVALLQIDAMSEPFVGPRSGLRLADAGFAWMTHFPHGAHHTVTTMYDAAGQVIQWYIDICRAHGVDEADVPWFDDLYLDIVVYPDGRVVVLDEDELDAALVAGAITQEDHDLAWHEARQLLDRIERNTLGPAELARRSAAHRTRLLALDGSPSPKP
jgi:predicted RNA-binding protein associated with RNAse of E/G family